MNQNKKHIDNRHRLDEDVENLLAQLSVPARRTKDDVWESLGSVINSQQSGMVRAFTPAKLWIAAASIAVLLSVGSVLTTYSTRVVCPRGQHAEVVLPDGSSVLLNSDSELSYKKYMWWRQRVVNLSGEAFFKVKKGKRFEVHSGSYVTSVLGTTFNVFLRNNQVKVSCFTGKVGVKDVNSNRVAVLTPGLGVKSSGASLGNVEKVTVTAKGWTSGEFYFNNALFTDVVAEIERQFNVKITAGNIENRRYTGYFRSNDLKTALELVCVPMQLDYRIASTGEVVINPVN